MFGETVHLSSLIQSTDVMFFLPGVPDCVHLSRYECHATELGYALRPALVITTRTAAITLGTPFRYLRIPIFNASVT